MVLAYAKLAVPLYCYATSVIFEIGNLALHGNLLEAILRIY